MAGSALGAELSGTNAGVVASSRACRSRHNDAFARHMVIDQLELQLEELEASASEDDLAAEHAAV
jgi:hypothetical protein